MAKATVNVEALEERVRRIEDAVLRSADGNALEERLEAIEAQLVEIKETTNVIISEHEDSAHKTWHRVDRVESRLDDLIGNSDQSERLDMLSIELEQRLDDLEELITIVLSCINEG